MKFQKIVFCVLLSLIMTFSILISATAEGQTLAISGENITIGNLALRPDGAAGLLYENEGLKLLIPLEYDDLLITDVLNGSEDGVLFSVSEKASVEAAKSTSLNYEGAGWLFSIGRVSEDELHRMLCYDMSGAEVFAVGPDGSYYVYYHPTDVRFMRESTEAMIADQEQWTMLNAWAGTICETFLTENPELNAEQRGNSMLDMYLARAAYQADAVYTVSTTQFGPMEPGEVPGALFAEQLMTGNDVSYEEADILDTPDGEYVVLYFPDDDVRFDFFLANGGENYVRQTWSDFEMLYKAVFTDGTTKASDIMQEWYDTLVSDRDMRLLGYTPDSLLGSWAEKIAGRGYISISKNDADSSYDVQINWSASASEMYVWTMTAKSAGCNVLRYEDGKLIILTFGEGGIEESSDLQYENGTGEFRLLSTNELIWQDDIGHAGDDTVFISE